jgi:S1-C subfamily serine protease
MPDFPIVRNQEEAKAHSQDDPALVEVPGKYVAGVVRLIGMLLEPGQDEVGRTIKALRNLGGKGVIVTNIGPASRAATAGMARGDVLLRYDGVQLGGFQKLSNLTRRTDPSKRVTVDAFRGAHELRFEVDGGPLGITVHRLT